MKRTLTGIVLVVVAVLSLFLVAVQLRFTPTDESVESNMSGTLSAASAKRVTPPSEPAPVPASNTSVADINAVLHENNRTLDKNYKSVASEIEDFLRAKKVQRLPQQEENLSEANLTPVCKVPPKVSPPPAHQKEQAQATKPVSPKAPHKELKTKKRYRGPPRLVIIMDDIRSVEQGEMIKRLPFKVTPSIFPVTQEHPDTRKVARMFASYMIHTPMEAFHYPKEEENTLKTGDSLRTIERRIRAIKHDFPHLCAINNHTGSKFTSDARAMDRLFCALQKYGIRFVDSRTAPTTKACQIGKLHGCRVLSRNVFLDNVDNVDAILKQLRESVAYAKAHQVAIAICHPRPATFEALMRAKPLLKGVRVVTIDALYR